MQFNHQNLISIPYGPDSFYIPNFTNLSLGLCANQVFHQLSSEIDWVARDNTAIMYRGNSIKRTKGFFTANVPVDPICGIPQQIFKYSYPGFTYRILLQHKCFRDLPILDQVVQNIAGINGLTFQGQNVEINHGIATQYQRVDDNIGAHQDKLIDIVPETPILSLSFGDRREMQFTNLDGKVLNTIVLEPGSLFVLGPQTNKQMKHAIIPIAKETVIKRDAPCKPRISIVLRNIVRSLKEEDIVKIVTASINASLEKKPLPLVSAAIDQLKKQEERVSLNDVRLLDQLFERERHQMKEEEDDTVLSQSTTPAIDDTGEDFSVDNNVISAQPTKKKIKMI